MSLELVVTLVGAVSLWVVSLSFFVSLWLAVVVQFRSLSLGEQINRLGKSSDWFLLIVAYYRLGFVYQTANRREYPGSVFFIGEHSTSESLYLNSTLASTPGFPCLLVGLLCLFWETCLLIFIGVASFSNAFSLV